MSPELRQESRTNPTLIGASQEAVRMREFAFRAASTEHTILLQGESGVGKDQLAELIHFNGRRTRPFVPVDCGALTETLSESELFGHVPGAFTDARTTKVGLVQVADNGTLFFNEVANMSLTLQAKFLRVLEKKTFRQVGGTKEFAMNTRIIAATNVDLEDAVIRGALRLDLFHRLSTIMFTVAPLRGRREDIPLLAEHFLKQESESKQFSEEAMEAMVYYRWPGNVRELKNVVARAAFDSLDESEIQTEHLYFSTVGLSTTPSGEGIVWGEDIPTYREAKMSYLREVLIRARGNHTRAAEIAGVSVKVFSYAVKHSDLKDFVYKLKKS